MFEIVRVGDYVFRIDLRSGQTWKLMGYGLEAPVWVEVKEKG
jgi:hypothetical protein